MTSSAPLVFLSCAAILAAQVPGSWTPHMKGMGMLVGNFELNPLRRPIWAWPKLFLTPKRDHVKTQTIYVYFYIFHVQP